MSLRPPISARRAIDDTERWWLAWSSRSTYDGEWPEAVQSSLIALKALTFAPSASLLMILLVGFLPPSDERVRGTVEAVERELCEDGFVLHYRTETAGDGLPSSEGAFLPCTFWLADNLSLLGRVDEVRALFERLLNLPSDLGLLAEEYDPQTQRLVGNYPQAFSHVGLIDTARTLSGGRSPVERRAHRDGARGHGAVR